MRRQLVFLKRALARRRQLQSASGAPAAVSRSVRLLPGPRETDASQSTKTHKNNSRRRRMRTDGAPASIILCDSNYTPEPEMLRGFGPNRCLFSLLSPGGGIRAACPTRGRALPVSRVAALTSKNFNEGHYRNFIFQNQKIAAEPKFFTFWTKIIFFIILLLVIEMKIQRFKVLLLHTQYFLFFSLQSNPKSRQLDHK